MKEDDILENLEKTLLAIGWKWVLIAVALLMLFFAVWLQHAP